MDNLRHLLIIYHSKTGHTKTLTDAVISGAQHPDVSIEIRIRRAVEAGPEDLLWADGLLLGTPENFGYMSGAMKDFFDRTFYEVEGKLPPLPYALYISAGNDGSGAVRAIKRIANGYPLVEVHQPLIIRGDISDADLAACTELGQTLAAGTELAIF